MAKKTRKEIEELKRGWASDPCFDIEDTEGFEDVRDELIEFKNQKEFEREEARMTRIRKLAEEFGFVIGGDGMYDVQKATHVEPQKFITRMEKLLDHVDDLEDRLNRAEVKLDRLSDATDSRFRRIERD